MKKPIPLIIILLGILVAGFFFLRPNDTNAANIYETETARIGDIATSVEATGSVRAYQSAIFLWETSGIVESVNVNVGDTVQKGDVLASLRADSLPPANLQAEADLMAAEQNLEDVLGSAGTEAANAAIALREAREAYEDAVNYRALLDEEVEYDVFTGKFKRLVTPWGTFKIPKIENIRYYPSEEQKAEAEQDIILQKALLDDAQRRYDQWDDGPQERDIAAAEAQILAAQRVLDQANIFASFDGVITKVDTQVGDQIAAGTQAFRLDNFSQLLIDLNVSEIDINSISLGQTVTINFEAVAEKSYQGEVVDIAVASSPSTNGTTGYEVSVRLLDADQLVRAGMTADVLIQVREAKAVLLIPNQAIRMLNGERVIYLLRNGESLEAVPIKLGVRDTTHSEELSGNVQAGDVVVLNPPTIPTP